MNSTEEKVFKVSEEVETMKEIYKDKRISLYSDEHPRQVGQPDESLVTKAYNQYCDMWNSNEKARGFVKYLIHNFLPINNLSKVLSYTEDEIKNNLNRCCILRIKLGNVSEMVDYFAKVGMQRLVGSAHAAVEGRTTLPKENVEEIKRLQKITPVEIKNGTVGYISKDEKKYLSGEALVGLKIFVEDCLLRDVKEVTFLIKKKMFNEGQKHVKKEKRLNDKQINQVVARSTYGAKSFVDEETINKLQKLKAELEKKEK